MKIIRLIKSFMSMLACFTVVVVGMQNQNIRDQYNKEIAAINEQLKKLKEENKNINQRNDLMEKYRADQKQQGNNNQNNIMAGIMNWFNK